MRGSHTLFVGCLVWMTSPATAQQAGVEYLGDIQERFLAHRQGWGELGVNVAAHTPDQKPAPLQIGEKRYARGIGHHAPGEIIIDLSGEYARFEAEVGIQRQGDTTGSVVFQVFADDEKRFDSGVLRAADAPKRVSVPVAGAQELRLVVTDAGDGITCDVADWAQARLVRDPDAKAAIRPGGFDIARFARVVSSDPSRRDGARSNRIQEYRDDDVFLEKDIQPDAQGRYTVTAQVDGLASIGLRWIERRRIRQVTIAFADARHAPSPLSAQVQYWTGESPYQGEWRPFNGTIIAANDEWTFRPASAGNPDLRTGTWKVRWIFEAGAEPVTVRELHASAPTVLRETALRIEFEGQAQAAPIDIDIYNGEFAEPVEQAGKTRARLAPDAPRTIRLRHLRPRPWQAERTVIRFGLPSGGFGVAVDDVLANQAVYVPAYGAIVATADSNLDLAKYRGQIKGRTTILQEVCRHPDQTREQAIERVHRSPQDPQPIMLSLACDNRKFIVHRDGLVQFPLPTEAADPGDAGKQPYSCRFKPAFGVGKDPKLTRHLDGRWYPAPVTTIGENGVAYRMRSYVAPFAAPDSQQSQPWLRSRAIFVAEIAVENAGAEPAEASVDLAFEIDAKSKCPPPTLRYDAARAIVVANGRLLAAYEHDGDPAKNKGRDGSPTLAWTLSPKQARSIRVLIPAWELAGTFEEAAALFAPKDLFARFRAYWDGVLAPAMQIQVPDDFVNDVIRASQVHCLIAARNEDDGRRIAPWIAAVHYGPLESESHSIIRGMDLLGHHRFAQNGLDFFIHRYNPAGFLTTGYTLMGTGWHLQVLGQHWTLAPDAEWMKAAAPKVAGVCRWILKQRAKTQQCDATGERPIESGLMPPGVMADWNAFAYHFCLNGYYYAGLRGAAEALRAIGHPEAEAFLTNAAAFHDDILRAYRIMQARMPVYPLRDGTSVPGYPAQLLPGPTGPFFPGDDGNRSWCYDVELGAHQLVPQGVLAADSREVAWMMDHMEDVQFLADGWFDFPGETNRKDPFNLGGFSKVQPYYTRNGEIYAMRDDVKPFVRSYFNTMASLLSLEVLSFQEHFRGVGAWNKTHETGYFLQQSRFMLVMEHGDQLWLAPLVTNQWFRDGMVIDVRNAPSSFGTVGFRIESRLRDGFITAVIEPPGRLPPRHIVLRLRHPDGRPIKAVEVNGKVHTDFEVERECIRLAPAEETIRVRASY